MNKGLRPRHLHRDLAGSGRLHGPLDADRRGEHRPPVALAVLLDQGSGQGKNLDE